MKTESKELRLMAYLDNEVSASEGRQIAAWIARDAEARALFEELKATRELVRGNEAELAVPETRDFYWSQISRRMATAEREGVPAEAAPAKNWWLRFLAPATALSAIALFAITSFQPDSRNYAHTEASETDRSISFYSPEHRMNVVWIPSGNEQAVAEATVEDWEF